MLDLRAKEVRRFWRAALQHLRVARRLAEFGNDRVLQSEEAYHAVYVGGDAIECGLKALYLSRTGSARHEKLIDSTLKEIGHNLDGLYHSINSQFGITMPADVRNLFRTCITRIWFVGQRYAPGQRRRRDVNEFLDAVEEVLDWIERQ